MREYLRLLRFVKAHKLVFTAAVLCMVSSTIFSGVQWGVIMPFVDNVFTGRGMTFPNSHLQTLLQGPIDRLNSIPRWTLLKIMIALVPLIFLSKGLSEFGQNYLMNDVSQRVIREIRNKLYQKLQFLSMDFYSRQRTGELVSRIIHDVSIIRDTISQNLTDLIYQSFQLIFFLTMVFFTHWRLALVSLVILPMIMFPVLKITRRVRKLSKRSQEKMADISSTLFETISGIRIVKAFGMEDYEIERFKDQTNTFYRLVMKRIKRMAAIAPLTEFIGAVVATYILWHGGRQVIEGMMSFGVFCGFLAALFLLMKPIKKLSRVQALIQQTIAAAVRIFKILDTEPTVIEKKGAYKLPPIREKVSFDNVWFEYEEKKSILEGINLEVKSGEVVALVGLSGVGKTSLANLIPRFYDPSRGRVMIDGRDIKDVTLKSLRDQIGMVTQETILFNDTVRANIAYGRLTSDEEKIVEAAKAANAHQFIDKMPGGYDAIIGERGAKLSGGEKQRLAIARAILKNPPILILDEATSQLDTESERLVQEALERLMRGRTVVVIAHRLSTITRAKKIVVLDGGKIVDVGRHEELIARSGLYKRLYEMQFREP